MGVAKEEIQRRMARFERVCRQDGLKVTHQRTQIFRELAGTQDHPDVETIYKRVHRRVPAVSLDTVYRTLALLEEKGLVRRAELQSGPARYDANTDPHHHFVCSVCGFVRDVHSREMDNLAAPSSVRRIGTVLSSNVQLRGLCARCAQGRRK